MTNKQVQITINAIKFMLDNAQYSEDVEEALNMAISALTERRWIPCSDTSTLPKDKTYWVTHTNGYESWVDELYWDMTEWSDRVSDVVAWMPCNIPEPYWEGD